MYGSIHSHNFKGKNLGKIVLLRHGLSLWNQLNIFTGWVDVPLCPEGIEEAFSAGEKIKEIEFDVVFTSHLSRASMTAILALSKSQRVCCPVVIHEEDWYKIPEIEEGGPRVIPVYAREALNERYYGDFQGKNKDQVKQELGEEKFCAYRRSYATRPPGGESLQDTIKRMIPCFNDEIMPMLIEGKNILISAHGNSIRGILKQIDDISDEEIVSLEVPTGLPITYEYEEGMWQKLEV